MKIIYSNLKKGEVKIKIENPDDYWYLSTIIDKGDLVKGKTIRKIKIGEKEQRSMKIVKKPVHIAIRAEKVEFSKTTSMLRIAGVVTECPEDVPHGSHHTFNVEVDTIITIIKGKWLKFQLDRLKEASSKEIARIKYSNPHCDHQYFRQFVVSFKDALKIAVTEKGVAPQDIMKYAKICRVGKIVKPILETMI